MLRNTIYTPWPETSYDQCGCDMLNGLRYTEAVKDAHTLYNGSPNEKAVQNSSSQGINLYERWQFRIDDRSNKHTAYHARAAPTSSLNAGTIDLFHFWHKAVTTRNYIVCEIVQCTLGELKRP